MYAFCMVYVLDDERKQENKKIDPDCRKKCVNQSNFVLETAISAFRLRIKDP